MIYDLTIFLVDMVISNDILDMF